MDYLAIYIALLAIGLALMAGANEVSREVSDEQL